MSNLVRILAATIIAEGGKEAEWQKGEKRPNRAKIGKISVFFLAFILIFSLFFCKGGLLVCGFAVFALFRRGFSVVRGFRAVFRF